MGLMRFLMMRDMNNAKDDMANFANTLSDPEFQTPEAQTHLAERASGWASDPSNPFARIGLNNMAQGALNGQFMAGPPAPPGLAGPEPGAPRPLDMYTRMPDFMKRLSSWNPFSGGGF